jgi:hypothetical protein
VTDLRFYEDNQVTPKLHMVDHVMNEMREGCKVILSVGLTRPFQGQGRPAAEYWLQINNVHLSSYLLWQDAPKPVRLPSWSQDGQSG